MIECLSYLRNELLFTYRFIKVIPEQIQILLIMVSLADRPPSIWNYLLNLNY